MSKVSVAVRGGAASREIAPKVDGVVIPKVGSRTVARTDGWADLNRLSSHESIIDTVDRREAEAGIDGLGACVELFRQLGDSAVWGVIECVGRVETRYADSSLDKFCETHGVPLHTAYRFRRIFSAFPSASERLLDLSVAHHYVAATTDQPGKWLARADRKRWSVREFMQAVAEATKKELPESTETEDGDTGAAEALLAAANSVTTVDEAEQVIRGVVRQLKTMGDWNRRVLTRMNKAMVSEGAAR